MVEHTGESVLLILTINTRRVIAVLGMSNHTEESASMLTLLITHCSYSSTRTINLITLNFDLTPLVCAFLLLIDRIGIDLITLTIIDLPLLAQISQFVDWIWIWIGVILKILFEPILVRVGKTRGFY